MDNTAPKTEAEWAALSTDECFRQAYRLSLKVGEGDRIAKDVLATALAALASRCSRAESDLKFAEETKDYYRKLALQPAGAP